MTEPKFSVKDRVVSVRLKVEDGPTFTLQGVRARDNLRYTVTEVMVDYHQPASGGPWRCGDVIATGTNSKDMVPRARLYRFGDHDTPDWVAYVRLVHYPRWNTEKESK